MGFFPLIDRKFMLAIFRELFILFVLWGLVLEAVDDDVGINSFTGDAFRLKVLNRSSLEKELRSYEEARE